MTVGDAEPTDSGPSFCASCAPKACPPPPRPTRVSSTHAEKNSQKLGLRRSRGLQPGDHRRVGVLHHRQIEALTAVDALDIDDIALRAPMADPAELDVGALEAVARSHGQRDQSCPFHRVSAEGGDAAHPAAPPGAAQGAFEGADAPGQATQADDEDPDQDEHDQRQRACRRPDRMSHHAPRPPISPRYQGYPGGPRPRPAHR